MSHLRSKPSISTARDPPPSLFTHPTPTASHVSVPGMATTGASTLFQSVSGSTSNMPLPSGASTQPSQVPTAVARNSSLLNPRSRSVALPRLHTADSARTADRTDALWAEMQLTLEEVEVSARGGTHVFGPDHDRKLAELRAAQIALAQAWARSEADDAGELVSSETEVRNLKGALGDVGTTAAAAALGASIPTASAGRGAADSTDGGRSTVGAGSGRPGSSGRGGERLGARLEEETERDILLARTRREANDRYFDKVDQGVKDVVAKLEQVAIAMKAVEQETRDIWDEGDSAPASAKP
ncbi:hypothetical protein F5X96DRAFT_640383 [Biscogniauxia mediterranea]|nr:hypothetical protein F5X96DRAFT_640383 [Biscogniauxia mediterranea]